MRVKRTPIIQPQYEVVVSQEPIRFTDLVPKYRYEFQNIPLSEESSHMYQSLIDFIGTNENLALEGNCTEDYQRGFQRAIALTRLWIDSLYIPGGEKQP